MFDLILLIIIRAIDLPLLENQPFLYLKFDKKWKYGLYSLNFDEWVFYGKKLQELENNYTLVTGLYEYNLLIKLRSVNNNKFIKFSHKIWFDLAIILTCIHLRWDNIKFIIGSILLPIFFYYFFVLMDYLEVMEEFIQGIWEAIAQEESRKANKDI